METSVQRRYRAFGDFLKESFGCKVYKVSIDAGFTCPNRDGRISTGGCAYCNNRGFSPNTRREQKPVAEQVAHGAEYLRRRYGVEKFIAYFQAYTNTYGPLEKLRTLYDEALAQPDIVGLSVGTRPDCVEDEVLDLLQSYSETKQVWLELGLQSAHDETLRRVNRGHTVGEFVETVRRTKQRPGIHICAHVILGLPGESRQMMLDSASLISDLGVHGVKVHLFHILKDTPLSEEYDRGEVKVFEMGEYVSLVCDYLELLDSGIVIQRLTADGPSDILLAPRWAHEKKRTIDRIEKELLIRDTSQGAKRLSPM